MKKNILSVFVLILIISCNYYQPGNSVKDQNNTSPDSNTPYADIADLESIAEQSDKYVDWKVARVFAVIEKMSFCSEYNWSNSKISERPVLIYNHELEPKYYEFRVIKLNQEIGSIACNAQKEGGKPVQYVMDFAKIYNTDNIKNFSISTKIIDAGYPSKVISRDIGSKNLLSDIYNPITGNSVLNKIEFEVPVSDYLKFADNDVLKKLGVADESIKSQLLKKADQDEADNKAFWDSIEKVKDSILKTTDDEIAAAALSSYESLVKGNWTSTFILYPWWNKAFWVNPGGWCGPNCLEFISIGADCYPGVAGIPGNNYETVTAVYDTFLNDIGSGAKIWEDLKRGLSNHTTYTLNYENFFSNKSHDWNKINSEIQSYYSPAISLRTWASVNGHWSWSWHYRVICGTYRSHTEWRQYFLWWSWIASRNYDYYLMHDNGADGQYMSGGYNWWETAGSWAQFESITAKPK